MVAAFCMMIPHTDVGGVLRLIPKHGDIIYATVKELYLLAIFTVVPVSTSAALVRKRMYQT